MTIKKLVIIALYSIISFIFLSLLCGEGGFLVNRNLEKRYEELERKGDLYMVEIESLENQLKNGDSYTQDDAAHFMGLERQGEKVYYFDSSDEEVELESTVTRTEEIEEFSGFPKYILAILGLIIGIVLFLLQTLFHFLFVGRSTTKSMYDNPKRSKTAKKGRGQGYDDIDF